MTHDDGATTPAGRRPSAPVFYRSTDHKAWPVPVWNSVVHECCHEAAARHVEVADLRRRVEAALNILDRYPPPAYVLTDVRGPLLAVLRPAGSAGSGELS